MMISELLIDAGLITITIGVLEIVYSALIRSSKSAVRGSTLVMIGAILVLSHMYLEGAFA